MHFSVAFDVFLRFCDSSPVRQKTAPKRNLEDKAAAKEFRRIFYYLKRFLEVTNRWFACVAAPKMPREIEYLLNRHFIADNQSINDKPSKLHRLPRIFPANLDESSAPTHRFDSSLQPCGTNDFFSFCKEKKKKNQKFFYFFFSFSSIIFSLFCKKLRHNKLERALCTAKSSLNPQNSLLLMRIIRIVY